ncbi:LOW QUALITY PROTEIN: Hypothetical protein PHPALM_17086 [Phytophthora palmivora]|uniref:Uncharacterized protein n=1 Tax=Phytophthora palmivora TaxID=4796 RepID=A0A2P4XN46_9STRA|nr:LOW QUALITY PROTEIN: Hypothetical protein PHPALM_17086 [Phytophthora palmivora]
MLHDFVCYGTYSSFRPRPPSQNQDPHRHRQCSYRPLHSNEARELSLSPGTIFEACPTLPMVLAVLMPTAPSVDVITNLSVMLDQA